MSIAIAMAQYLDSVGLIDFDDTGVTGNAFIDTLPDAPDLAVGLYHTGGFKADGKGPLQRPTIGLIIRGERDPRSALTLAEGLISHLHSRTGFALTANGPTVRLCTVSQSVPIHLGTDQNGRHKYSVNLQLLLSK